MQLNGAMRLQNCPGTATGSCRPGRQHARRSTPVAVSCRHAQPVPRELGTPSAALETAPARFSLTGQAPGSRNHGSRSRSSLQAAGGGGGNGGEPLLTIDSMMKTHDGEAILFSDVNFTVHRGDKLVIVGPNGSGKTSLLRLLSGDDTADSGTVRRRKGARIGYLPQEPVIDGALTVLDAVLASDSDSARAVRDYQHALLASAGPEGSSSAAQAAMDKAMDQMNALNAWALDTEASEMLEAVGLHSSLLEAPVGSLSGGQRRRVALAAALLSAPDVLILDEPTNHMDLEAIRWMEKALSDRKVTLVLVTHDRAFLEALATGLLELDGGKAHFHPFGGNGCYDQFRQAREERRHAQAAVAANAKTLLRKETEWMRRQPKARQAKAQAREQQYYQLVSTAKSGPAADVAVDLQAASKSMSRQGTKVLVLEDASVEYDGRPIVREFSYDFERGARIGVVGANGCGKTTLINMLIGQLPLASGVREEGETTVIGHFTQQPPELPPNLRIIDYIRDFAQGEATDPDNPGDTPEMVLERLGFPRPVQHREVGLLSGGQRRRLQLAAVLMGRPNVLVLDEPTNDLDLGTVEVMEELLGSYRGVLLVVSHDRRFMQSLTDRLFVLEGDSYVRMYDGLYYDYLEDVDQRKKEAATQLAAEQAARRAANAKPGLSKPAAAASQNGNGNGAGAAPDAAQNGNGAGPQAAVSSNGNGARLREVQKPAAAKGKQTKMLKLGYREQQEFEKLEPELDMLGSMKSDLEAKVAALSSSSDFEALSQSADRLAQLVADIDSKTERWIALAERAEAHA